MQDLSHSQTSVFGQGAPQEDFSFMGKPPKAMDVSFMPKNIADTSYESSRNQKQRLSLFSTSSGISKKSLSSEELELQAIMRKREQKLMEKLQA